MPGLRWRRAAVLTAMCVTAACGDDAGTTFPTRPTPDATTPGPPPAAAVEFILGWVRDSAFRPLSGARVQLLNGPDAGAAATTDDTGEFSFTAIVNDDSRLRAEVEGHVPGEITLGAPCIGCPGHPGRSASFNLQVLDSPIAIAGNYSLTITADPACASLPPSLRSRTYEVAIAPTPSRFGRSLDPQTSFEVRPHGGAFAGRMRFFWVNVAGAFVLLDLGNATDPAIVETIAPAGGLAFTGTAARTVADASESFVVPFTGTIEYCMRPVVSEDGYRCTAPPDNGARCRSDQHQLAFVRR